MHFIKVGIKIIIILLRGHKDFTKKMNLSLQRLKRLAVIKDMSKE